MNSRRVEEIANAVLYEGYLLYPYRASSVKNQQRFNFGVLTPRIYSEAQRSSESWSMQTECLLLAGAKTILDVKLRFLHLRQRDVRVIHLTPVRSEESVPELQLAGETYRRCEEAVEREAVISHGVSELSATRRQHAFSFPATHEREPLFEANGQRAGVLARTHYEIKGSIEVSITDCWWAETNSNRRLYRLRVLVSNDTQCDSAGDCRRHEILPYSLMSAHVILSTSEGEFVSLLDPPEEFREAAAACTNIGTWPVLAGESGTRDTMLSSPIILYDYPEIAGESPGELFDGTEIDEILTLRIMTLSDEEKRELREGDERARAILERTENMPPEQFMKMHGVWRQVRYVTEDEDERIGLASAGG